MAKISRTKVTESAELDGYTNEDVINDVEQGLDEAEQDIRKTHRPDTSEDHPVHERSVGKVKRVVSSGWGAPAEERRETVKAPNLILKDKGKRIVKILDDEPPVKYKRHYLNSTKRYYTCLQQGCPLCQAGVRASWTFMINVVDMTDDPSEVKAWTFGNEVATQLQSHAEDRDITDSKWYFHVYHEKIANRDAPATRVLPLKARDVEEDYSIQALTEDELATLEDECYGEEIVYLSTLDYLEDVAAGVVPTDLPQKRK
jgi:hypothetical protein